MRHRDGDRHARRHHRRVAAAYRALDPMVANTERATNALFTPPAKGPAGVAEEIVRLAAELAGRVEPFYPGGVRWIGLAHVTKLWSVAWELGSRGGPPRAFDPHIY